MTVRLTGTAQRLFGIGLAAALLPACTPPAPGFRDLAVPVASTTRFEADRMRGDWTRVAAFRAEDLTPPCRELRIAPAGAELAVATCGRAPVAHRIDPLGRMIPADGPPLWVLWVDTGFRTAAIGTPDGTFGWIMERGAGPTPPDRLAAAREILDFNGYDTARLIVR